MRKNVRWLLICCVFLSTLFSIPLAADALATNHVATNPVATTPPGMIINVNGLINPAMRDYVERALALAAKNHAPLVVIALNSMGGLEHSVYGVNAAILSSSVPVVAFVPPQAVVNAGATLVLYASPLVAMADNALIGAPFPQHQHQGALQQLDAYFKSLAKLHARRADWGALTNEQHIYLTAEHAKASHIVNIIANTEPDLLNQLSGHTVLVLGVQEKLDSAHIVLEPQPYDFRYYFLNFITNPNIAYLLLLIAIYGLFFEFSIPGKVFPGFIGLVALFLTFYAFRLMPVNYTGLTLLFVGICFMIFETYLFTYYLMDLCGLIAFIFGSILLFDIHQAQYHLAILLILAMSIITISFLLMLMGVAMRIDKHNIHL